MRAILGPPARTHASQRCTASAAGAQGNRAKRHLERRVVVAAAEAAGEVGDAAPAPLLGRADAETAGGPAPPPAEATPPRDDDVLPDNLRDSLQQAALSASEAMAAGVRRAVVEVLIPEFWDPSSGPVFSGEGDQMRFWQLARILAGNLKEASGCRSITVVFPDIGVAQYLKQTWTDVDFRIGTLRDRQPLAGDEDLVVMAAPDPQGAEAVVRVATAMPVDTPLVLFNPRLVSGDVGVGLNVRRIRSEFLSQFLTVYSIRPLGDVGTIFRRYPAMWKVFVQDEACAGRYRLAAERPERPVGDSLDLMLQEALGNRAGDEGQQQNAPAGVLANIGATLSSVQRFMRQLSNS